MDIIDKLLALSWMSDKFKSTRSTAIYHYTSAEAFMKIIQNGRINLRFSDYHYMNDASEGKYSLDLYSDICKSVFADDGPALEFFSQVQPSKKTLSLVGRAGEAGFPSDTYGRSEYREFICCFSKNGDSLPMWRGYLQGQKYGGCALGFYSIDQLVAALHPENIIDKTSCHNSTIMPSNIYAIQIVYNKEKQEDIIIEYLQQCREIYYNSNETAKNSMRSFLEGFLALIKLAFKSHFFAYEEEVRLVYRRQIHQQDDQPPCIQHFPRQGFLVPNVILQSNKNNVLRNLRIAPMIECEIAKESYIAYLKNNDFHNVKILFSDIPMRY